jgi:hypothetical protein
MRLSRRQVTDAQDRLESWITQQHQRRVLAGETTPIGLCPDEDFLQDLARRSKRIALSDPPVDHAANCSKCMRRLLEIRKVHWTRTPQCSCRHLPEVPKRALIL